ncbi:IS4 family transposase [Paracoccus alcaliphilus]|nr:IS4 family transposase [Paracoccus alcaliphilus]
MGQSWVETETAGCDLGDVRLNRRLEAMLEALGERPGKSLPTAFQDWSNTKAAYRFFANGNVSEDKILEGHFAASALRIRATDGPILILQDTTEFSFKRSAPEKVGFTTVSTGRKLKEGRYQKHAVCGLLMHASMAITPDGLPLGLTAAKFWSRSKFKGTAALKRKINPTRVPIEQKESMRWLDNLRLSTELTGVPERCVHIGDRESDIYELYCLSEELGTGFLVRSCVDRLAEDGGTTIAKVMAEVQSSGTHEVRFRDAQGKDHCAVLSVRHATMTVRPPIGKQRKYRHQNLQIIHAEELDPPEGRVPVFWKLITNLPVATHADAIHKLQWYALRWKIETFFRTLKTGCRIEELRLATADRLANCIALCCVVSWRVSWMTMLGREVPKASPAAVFTDAERQLLERTAPESKQKLPRDLDFYVRLVARL